MLAVVLNSFMFIGSRALTLDTTSSRCSERSAFPSCLPSARPASSSFTQTFFSNLPQAVSLSEQCGELLYLQVLQLGLDGKKSYKRQSSSQQTIFVGVKVIWRWGWRRCAPFGSDRYYIVVAPVVRPFQSKMISFRYVCEGFRVQLYHDK